MFFVWLVGVAFTSCCLWYRLIFCTNAAINGENCTFCLVYIGSASIWDFKMPKFVTHAYDSDPSKSKVLFLNSLHRSVFNPRYAHEYVYKWPKYLWYKNSIWKFATICFSWSRASISILQHLLWRQRDRAQAPAFWLLTIFQNQNPFLIYHLNHVEWMNIC